MLSGVIPRVEAQAAHRSFVWAVRPSAVLLSIVEARKLVKRGETAESWAPPETAVVTTTTVSDEQLARLSREREQRWVEAFAPAGHIPADYPVYGDDDQAEQRERARKCARGTVWLADRVPGRTAIIPLIKGTTPEVRAITERVVRASDAPLAAVYAAQYFSQPGAGGWPTLAQDLRAIDRETDGHPVIVVGLLSAYYLTDAPASVVAAAGLRQWREAVTPRSRTPGEMRAAYTSFASDVTAALGGDA